jgi:hypothetical protein
MESSTTRGSASPATFAVATFAVRRLMPRRLRRPGAAGHIGLARGCLALWLLVAGCGGQPATQAEMDEAKAVALDVAQAGVRDCPWPAGADQYAETAPAGRDRDTPAPGAAAFDGMPGGCAILIFSVGETGIVGNVQVAVEHPPGFGPIAARVLRGYDYATGANSLTRFVVRIGARGLPSGAVLAQMTFKDRAINVILPR